jgi:hypothetical protein
VIDIVDRYMRKLWSNGWNSFWHFALGALSFKIPLVLVIFLIYQTVANKGFYDKNVYTDILEFFIGLITMIGISHTFNKMYDVPLEIFTEFLPDIISIF